MLLACLIHNLFCIDWAAYPHYTAPERFSPYVLDGKHLYYINTFESAASAIEAAAVSAQNVACLLLSCLSKGVLQIPTPKGVGEQVVVEDL
jgi:prenylcysteine oxidase/farnesylcysteine lyase